MILVQKLPSTVATRLLLLGTTPKDMWHENRTHHKGNHLCPHHLRTIPLPSQLSHPISFCKTMSNPNLPVVSPALPPQPPPNGSQRAVVLDSQQAKPQTKKSTRAGALNYSTEDVTAILGIVEEGEPLGANHWAVVASKFTVWVSDNSRPLRDQDYLKNKFDKLANIKKKTGDPSCPEPVRRAN